MSKTKNALILHGAGNNSEGNWFPWLKGELVKIGYQVFSPDLPHTDNPKLEEWLEAVKKTGFQFNEESVLIGHSCGGTLILSLLERLPKTVKIKRAILVAAPLDKGVVKEYWLLKEDLCQDFYNFEKIRNSCNEFILIYSQNDPYDCGERHGKVLEEELSGKLLIMKDQGHFNLEVSQDYKQFPKLLEIIG